MVYIQGGILYVNIINHLVCHMETQTFLQLFLNWIYVLVHFCDNTLITNVKYPAAVSFLKCKLSEMQAS